jgi:hypothetical protein
LNAEALILAKSFALIEKTKLRVNQIDSALFPTDSSEGAKKLLDGILKVLSNNARSPSVSPEALYNTLIRLQRFVEEVEASTSEHVSWPLVSYCHQLWRSMFPNESAHIFFSVTKEHNYIISRFSGGLRELLKPIISKPEIDNLLGACPLYCLQLASLEEENLPLYAIIGHEFGHALWHANESKLAQILVSEIIALIQLLKGQFLVKEAYSAERRVKRALWIIKSFAVELFCDLVGLLISGPAFLLSLQEMGWGANETRWSGVLLPEPHTVAYPSFRFRLHCVKSRASLNVYEAEAERSFKRLENAELKKLWNYCSTETSDHSGDVLSMSPDSDSDSAVIAEALQGSFAKLKTALEAFVSRCDSEFLEQLKTQPEFAAVQADHVATLLQRLENDVLPNVLPDGSLSGTPAPFSATLNASAIFRIHLLRRPATGADANRAFRDLQKVERLTAKALEVSYIQKEFLKWRGVPK